jgi:hypothetical protein
MSGVRADIRCPALVSDEMSVVANFVDYESMNVNDASGSVRDPSVCTIEAFGAVVANQNSQTRLGEALATKVLAGSGDERSADTKAPTRRVDIQGVQFAALVPVGAQGGTGRREPANCSFIDGDDGRWLKWVARAERVSLGAVFGAEGVEELVGHETSIAHLPRVNMNVCNLPGVIGCRGAEQHAHQFRLQGTSTPLISEEPL